jgi:GT2 family glycosyltransferase
MSVGGFDESLFGDLGDLDLCLRFRWGGFHTIFTPYAEFRLNSEPQQTQCNLKTNSTNAERALDLMKARWGDELKNDPYYSVNLSLKHCDYRVSSSSRATFL